MGMNGNRELVQDMNPVSLRCIGHIHSDYPTKFGIPRQSGLVGCAKAFITFEAEFQNPDCFRGIEEFSYLWLIWGFSENREAGWTPTVRPPRLGGNVRKGVFATRSPFRPNPIGLSSVRLEGLEFHPEKGPLLHISGADLMDGTPIYDIKPYIPYTDSHPDAAGSFAATGLEHRLTVYCAESLMDRIPQEKRGTLIETLALDPRPSYQNDPERVYGMEFDCFDIRFHVEQDRLLVDEILPININEKGSGI